jgi:hypothetical protein
MYVYIYIVCPYTIEIHIMTKTDPFTLPPSYMVNNLFTFACYKFVVL